MSYIVCAWYTPDYEAWVAPLSASLSDVGAPYDFLRVEKHPGGWARNTLRKPAMMIQAMRRHKGTSVIFLDVDARVHGPLDDLAAIETDIGLHMRVGIDRMGRPRLGMRSGTMVLGPTAGTLSFLRQWAELSECARPGTVDQNTLTQAVARTPGLTITNLPVTYCATAADKILNPVIAHERASGKGSVSKLVRGAARLSGLLRSSSSLSNPEVR